uniref:transmembrane protein 60 n=1 Tax=Myxine glutinosa TaxID=7769 RepID=UPI00358ED222
MMPLIHRVLMTWLFTMFFLVLVVLKLDNRAPWNWFLVFIPLWVFDLILLLILVVRLISNCRTGYDQAEVSLRKEVWYLVAMLLKVSFLLVLCFHLEGFTTAPLYLLFIPLWLLLLGAMIDLGHHVFCVLS